MNSAVIKNHELEIKQWDDPSLLLKVRWNGVNFYEFVLPNGKTLIMDPFFDHEIGGHNEYNYTPTTLPGGKWVNGADYIILTHGHFDHTGELSSILEEYPQAHVLIPEFAVVNILWEEKIDPNCHYITSVGSIDRIEFPDLKIETCRSNHNLPRGCMNKPFNQENYLKEDGSVDFFKFYNAVYNRDIMNLRITTKEGLSILIWNSEMQKDGVGYETRPWFYQNTNPDLLMYQVAGASFDYDRRNPNCTHMGKWIASIHASIALPEHQQHFSYEELDTMASKMSEICNQENSNTTFLTPYSAIWYGFSKDTNGNMKVYRVDK